MNPVQIAIALHYVNDTTDYNNGDFSDPLVGNTIEIYKDQGLLQPVAVLDAIASVTVVMTPVQPVLQPVSSATLVATDGMKMYVDALSKIPLPKQIWTL